jgi:hypothetical protein
MTKLVMRSYDLQTVLATSGERASKSGTGKSAKWKYGLVIEIPTTGERVEAFIVRDDPSAPLCVTLGAAVLALYVLAPMLAAGWRIVEATPVERAVLAANGITLDET